MSLISAKFLLFVNIVFVLYFLCPKNYRWSVLLLSSYVFYAMSSKWLTVFLVLTTVSVYGTALMISKQNEIQKKQKKIMEKPDFKAFKEVIKKRKKHRLAACLVINFGILAAFKYANFLVGNVCSLAGIFGSDWKFSGFNWVMPLGLSYYTLQAVSYIVDVYYGKYDADKHLGKVALYLSFFPQITEGPIGRFDKLANQLYTPHTFDYERFKMGGTLFIVGMFKKLVIADRAAIFVNEVFPNYKNLGGITLFMGAVMYTLQIYAEFSGAMDMAWGISKILGVDLDKNFRRPFFSLGIGEFWRRWHITLGAWLRDYVFYPVSLSKMSMNVGKWSRNTFKGHLGKFIPMAFPLFFVWFGNGFWHGASWKYILYGLYYYIIMMIGLLCKPFAEKLITSLHININSKGYKLFQMLRTTLFVLFGMLLFRSHSTADALNMTSMIFTHDSTGVLSYGLNRIDFILLLLCSLGMLAVSIINETGRDMYEIISKRCLAVKYVLYAVLVLGIFIFGIYGEGYNAADFIYGQF